MGEPAVKRRGQILAMLVAAGALAGCTAEAPTAPVRTPYLETADQAGRWLVTLEDGAAGIPDRVAEAGSSASLGAGSAGRAVFLAELHAATRESAYLELARRESARSLASIAPDAAFGLYNGISGIAFACAEVARLSGDTELADRSRALFQQIADRSPSRGGEGWGTVYDVLTGTAGVGLALLYAHERFGDPIFLDAAAGAGDALLAVAEVLPGGRTRWFRGADLPLDLPNFSHGTAGVGFFLARLGAMSGTARFAEAGRRAAAYLDSIARRDAGLYLVPYGVPDEGYSTPFDIGWAHGPPGTARLHYALWQATRDASLRERLDAHARTVVASGLPGPTADAAIWRGPFRFDRRFGTSGAALFLFDWGREAGGESFRPRGFEIADAIVAAATVSEEGARWRVPLYGFQGGEGEAVFTGYFYGASGLGLALLRAHDERAGRWPAIRLPDDPFPRRTPD